MEFCSPLVTKSEQIENMRKVLSYGPFILFRLFFGGWVCALDVTRKAGRNQGKCYICLLMPLRSLNYKFKFPTLSFVVDRWQEIHRCAPYTRIFNFLVNSWGSGVSDVPIFRFPISQARWHYQFSIVANCAWRFVRPGSFYR